MQIEETDMKHSHPRSFSRRSVLRAAAALGIPCVIPGAAFGLAQQAAPSERITLGFIGVGAMGRGHLAGFVRHANAQVLAVCDVDRWRRENAQKTANDAYATQRTSGTYQGCEAYNDLRELLARDDIDAVVIATGDNWHGMATVLAAEAGKDIYCEKPISKTIVEARAMVDAVRRYGRVCQIGLQQRSAREFRLACQLVRDGALGKIEIVYVNHPGTNSRVNLPAEPVPEGLDWDQWLGPAPWRPYNSRFHPYGQPHGVVPWHFCRDFGGGNLTSNAVHAFDVVQWGLGMDESGPVEIVPPETGEVPALTYKYANGTRLQVLSRLDSRYHRVPEGWDEITTIQSFGAVFVGERGWIHVGRQGYLVSFPADIIENYPPRYDHAIAVANHHQNWLDAIATRRRAVCDVAIGCQSTIVSHLGCIAHWTGRALKWDPEKEEFLNDDEANRLRRRAMRPPWQV